MIIYPMTITAQVKPQFRHGSVLSNTNLPIRISSLLVQLAIGVGDHRHDQSQVIPKTFSSKYASSRMDWSVAWASNKLANRHVVAHRTTFRIEPHQMLSNAQSNESLRYSGNQ